MTQNKAPPRAPQQSLLPTPEAREKFRLWHQQFREQQAREGNPVEKLSQSEAVQAFMRAQQDQAAAIQTDQESKQTAKQPPEQVQAPVEQPPEQIGQASEQTVEHVPEQIEQACEQTVEQVQIEQTTEQAPTEQPPEQIERLAKRRGHPPVDFPHLPEALAALGEVRSDLRSRVEKTDINYVVDKLRGHGDEVRMPEHEQTIRRRINSWCQDQIAYEEGKAAKAAGEPRRIPLMKRDTERGAWCRGYDGEPFDYEYYWKLKHRYD